MSGGSTSARNDWATLLPDGCWERILLRLTTRDLAALRLASSSWKLQVSYTLSTLSLKKNYDLCAAVASFPHISTLSLALPPPPPLPPLFSSPSSSATSSTSLLLDLSALQKLRNLHSLTLLGSDLRQYALALEMDQAMFARLATAAPTLHHLTLCKVALTPCLDQRIYTSFAINLKSLRLLGSKVSLDNVRLIGSRLSALEHLAIDDHTDTRVVCTITGDLDGSTSGENKASSAAQVWAMALASLHSLRHLHLGGSDTPVSDALLSTVLPSLTRLTCLHLSRPSWWSGYGRAQGGGGGGAPVTSSSTAASLPPLELTDDGLSTLVSCASTLQKLVIRGCWPVITNTIVHHLAALTALTSLDVRTYYSDESLASTSAASTVPTTATIGHGAMSVLSSSLVHLCHLHLGGWPISPLATRYLSCLPRLTRLEFSSCHSLKDSVAFELAKFTGLRHLTLQHCERITDIGLAAMSKGPLRHSLSSLELVSCHRNITDQGIMALAGFDQNLVFLNLQGCDLVSDASLVATLPRLRKLQWISLSDTRVTDACLDALGVSSLRVLHVEHCSGVTDRGVGRLHACRGLNEVRAFGSGVSGRGAVALERATGAVVHLRKAMWWSSSDTSGTTTTSTTTMSKNSGSVTLSTTKNDKCGMMNAAEA